MKSTIYALDKITITIYPKITGVLMELCEYKGTKAVKLGFFMG